MPGKLGLEVDRFGMPRTFASVFRITGKVQAVRVDSDGSSVNRHAFRKFILSAGCLTSLRS